MAGFPASASLRLLIRPEMPGWGAGCRRPRGGTAAPALPRRSPAQALTPPSAQINSALGSAPQLQHEAVVHQPPYFLQEEPGHIQIPKGMCKGSLRDGSPHQDTFAWQGNAGAHLSAGGPAAPAAPRAAGVLVLSVRAPPGLSHSEGLFPREELSGRILSKRWQHIQRLHEALSLKCPFSLQGACPINEPISTPGC